jgi:hypothetical protein
MAMLCANLSEGVHDEASNVSETHELPFARLMTLVAEVVNHVPVGLEVPEMRKPYRP